MTSEIPEPAGMRRLIVFYVILAVITAAGVIFVIGKGKDEKAQPRIAGGYDAAAPNPCLGKTPPPTGAPLPADRAGAAGRRPARRSTSSSPASS